MNSKPFLALAALLLLFAGPAFPEDPPAEEKGKEEGKGEEKEKGEGGAKAKGEGKPPKFSPYPRATEKEKGRILSLLPLLGHRSLPVRTWASDALLAEGEKAVPLLVEALKKAREPEVLFRLRTLLIRFRWVPDETIRWLATEGVRIVTLAVKYPPEKRQRIHSKILTHGSRILRHPALREWLRTPGQGEFKRRAVELVGEIGDKKRDRNAVEMLVEVIVDGPAVSGIVQDAASQALRKITGLRYKSFQKEKWKAWWERSRDSFGRERKKSAKTEESADPKDRKD
jgi:hypothetical protein